MPPPFDPTLKTLAELGPADWLPIANRRRCRVTVVDSDIGTIVSGASDKLFQVHDDPAYLLHLDFEAGHFHAALPLRLRLYNSVFEYRHQAIVVSVVVLLRPEADSPQWTGRLERGLPGEAPRGFLEYEVVRVWRLDPERLLRGGIGTLALAPVSAVGEGEVRSVIRRMRDRLSGPRSPRKAADVWAATYVLLGLRYSEAMAQAVFEEVLGMEESTTYQGIIRKGKEQGRTEEARRLLVLLGTNKFGRPNAAIRAAIEAIGNLERLEALGLRTQDAATWGELLAAETPRRGRGRRGGNGS